MSKNIKDSERQYHYGQFTPDHLRACSEGVKLYNERKFWECHEDLEDHWIEDISDNARYVYWAIIQVAASLYHLRNANMAGARGMIIKAQDKISQCKKRKVITDIMYNYLSWDEFSDLVMKVPGNEAEIEDFDDLYEFRFIAPENWEIIK